MLPLIRFYQRWISPLTVPRCRFYPTCSEYAATAIRQHGSAKGSYLAIKRLCRCHPLCEGGYDPVPERHPAGQNNDANPVDSDWRDTSCCEVAGNEKS